MSINKNSTKTESNSSHNDHEAKDQLKEGDQLKKPCNLGPFVINSKLGQGAFGKVFLATHNQSNEKVAIKIIMKNKIDNVRLLSYVENEIRIHKLFHHESIVRHYCIIETSLTISMVTEYCSNGELFNYVMNSPNKKLSEREACRLFQQLISGLEYMHKHKIAHRDIKLENLLLSEKNRLKITDFGLSKQYFKDKLKTQCGSPCYLAPEIVLGLQYSGETIDVWSSGIVLYSMVCGSMPFIDENQANLFNKITKGEYALPTFLSPSCANLIKAILCVEPSKRITISQIKYYPWFALLNYNMNNIVSPGVYTFLDIIPIDEEIIEEINSKYKFEIKKVIEAIILNKHNELTLVYYLLLNRKMRYNQTSISDISSYSTLFLEYIKGLKSKLVDFDNDIQNAVKYYKRIISKKLKQRKTSILIKMDFNISINEKDIFEKKNNLMMSSLPIKGYSNSTLSDLSNENNSEKLEVIYKNHFPNKESEIKDDDKDEDEYYNQEKLIGTSNEESIPQSQLQNVDTSMIYLPDEEEASDLLDYNISSNTILTPKWKKQKILQPITNPNVNMVLSSYQLI